jgi:hypothetical protein
VSLDFWSKDMLLLWRQQLRKFLGRKSCIGIARGPGWGGIINRVSMSMYIPKLGANLLSGRHLCEAGLVGSFNSGTMYFKLNRKTIIKAKMENSLYIVHHTSKRHKEMVFPSVNYNMSNSNNQPLPIPESFKQTSGLNQSVKDRYLLFY